MKRTLIALAVVALVAGCNNSPAPGSDAAAVTTAPEESQKPLEFETTPLVVDAAAVTEQDPALRAGAAWTAKQCALTVPGDAAEMESASAGPTRLTGFFIAPDDQPAGEFDIVLKGETRNFRIPAKTGWDRSDVASFFKMPQLATSGFDVNADLSGVATGNYKVDFMLERAGAKHFCESGKTLVVKAGAQPAAPVAEKAANAPVDAPPAG